MKPFRVVIVGAGFAGLNVAKELCRALPQLRARKQPVQITILDRRNHHLFQPLLYQVATAGLSPADIATPIRNLFSEPEVEVVLDEVVEIDPQQKWVQGKVGQYLYDALILACGANHSYFGKPEWEPFAPGLKTIEQATEIRRRILQAFEEAERAVDANSLQAWTTFVVVGGGPTGVELAGAIAELAQHTIRADYRRFDPGKARVLLVEAGPRILASFSEALSSQAEQDLKALGVQVHLNTRVQNINSEGVQVLDSRGPQTWSSKTVIWAAGVAPSILGRKLEAHGVSLDPSGRVRVMPELCLEKFKDIWVLGDQSYLQDSKNGRPLPGLAPVAMQQGRHAARNILRQLEGRPPLPFQYLDKGSMATIGRSKAVLTSGGIELSGFVAWLGWLVIHIYYLIGFKNRLFVFFQWIWSYLTFSRGARLIVDRDWKLKP